MSTIQISNLTSHGLNLFCDSENYMNELSEDGLELTKIHGGSTPCCVMVSIYSVAVIGGGVIGYEISRQFRS